jgi:hypothetical protein
MESIDNTVTSRIKEIRNNPKVRTTDMINQEIRLVDNYFNKKLNLIEKIFIRPNKKVNIISWLLFCIGMYILAYIGSFTVNNVDSSKFLDFTDTGVAIHFIYMSLYLFVHLFTVTALTNAVKRAVTTVPKVMIIPYEDYQKAINRFESNIWPILISIPFILYDFLDFYPRTQNNNFEYIGFFPDTVLFISWIIEWVIFGFIIWIILYYIRFIRLITKKFDYETELLTVVIRNEVKPIIYVGYEQSIILTVFLVLNIYYTIYVGFFLSDFMASVILFLLLPVLVFIPMKIINSDLNYELKRYKNSMWDKLLFMSKSIYAGEQVSIEEKVDFIVSDSILHRINQTQKAQKVIYLRLIATMLVPAFGYYLNYGEQVTSIINESLKLNIPVFRLFYFILVHLVHI